MKLSGKMCRKVILKVRKNQGLSLSLEDTLIKKPQTPFPPLNRFRVN